MKRIAILIPLLFAAALGFPFGAGEGGGFEYDGIGEIEIEAGTFEVDVQGTRGRTTSLEVRNMPDNFEVLHSRNGDRLEIWVERKFSFFRRPHHGELVLLVPEDSELRIRTSTGSVAARDIVSNRFSADTTTGSIVLEEVTASIRLETSTGSVEVVDCAGDFDINTTTGRIELDGVTGNVKAQSSTGSHSYENLMGDLTANSTTGRISIDTMQGVVELRTSTGSQEGRDILLTGNSSFESSTGDIRMDFVGNVEDIEFDLRSTTGSLRVDREESQRQLYLGGTGFTIRGKSSTGSQEYF